MDPLVSVPELAARVPFVMTDDEVREAEMALESLSDDARYYGKASWIDANSAPQQIKNLVLRAAARHMKNYEGYVQSRAGDEGLMWTDRGEEAGSAYFTKSEVRILQSYSGNRNSGFHSSDSFAWSTKVPAVDPNRLVKDEYGQTLPIYIPGVDLS